MGNYSWDCKACNRSIREHSSPVVAGPDGWMNKAVAVFSDSSVMRGDYDGYGHLYNRGSGAETELGEARFALYHEACYEHAGKPDFDGPSRSARDQGLGGPGEIIPFPPTKDLDADVIGSYESQILANVKGILGVIQSTDLDEGTLTLKDLERILSEREQKREQKFLAEMAERQAKQDL